ncbi:MAG: hypothetical protein ABSH07_10015 [Candidatus Dormibacteria bacterium]|jgi:hypothetical protein
MTTATRHLTIEQLLFAAGGRSVDQEAGAHLEACAACSAEADQWTVIAAGVRHFMAGVEPPPWSPQPPLLEAQKGPGWRERVLDALRASVATRRRLIATFSATALVAAGVSYGVVALGGAAHAPGPKVSTPGPSGSAQRVLLDSVQKTTAQSFDADLTFHDTTSGVSGQAPTTVTLPIEVQAESAAREKTTVSGTVAGTPVNVVAITYDGTAYESTNGGSTFQTEPASSISQYSIQTVLQLLQSVGSVTDEGSGTADGVAVEKYHAVIDPSKIQSELQSLSPVVSTQVRNILSAVTISGATADVTIDSSGRIVTLDATLTASVDGSALGLSGNPTVHETWSGQFFNYGADIVVQPPSTS